MHDRLAAGHIINEIFLINLGTQHDGVLELLSPGDIFGIHEELHHLLLCKSIFRVLESIFGHNVNKADVLF